MPSGIHHSTVMVCRTVGGEPRKFLRTWCHFMLPPVLFLLSALNQQEGRWEKYNIFFYCLQAFKEWQTSFFHLNDCPLPTQHKQTHKVTQQLTTACCRAWGQQLGSGGRERCQGKTCLCLPSDGEDIMVSRKKRESHYQSSYVIVNAIFSAWPHWQVEV